MAEICAESVGLLRQMNDVGYMPYFLA